MQGEKRMYLFDTSAVIDWLYNRRLGNKINGKIAISVLTLAELLPAAKRKSKKTLQATNEFLLYVEKIPVTEEIAMIAYDVKYRLSKRVKEEKIR